MQFAFLGKQVLRMGMTFHVFEGFLSLFLCFFIKGIFISEQSNILAGVCKPLNTP